MKKRLSEVLKDYLSENKMSFQAFADKSGLSKGYISFIINETKMSNTGKSIIPGISALKKLAKGLDLDINDLIYLIDEEISLVNDNVNVKIPSPEAVRTIPVYANISCGTGGFVDDDIVDTVSIPLSLLPNKSAEYFAQYAEGDSMIDAGINDGDLVVFKKTNVIENGQIGCFCIDENIATCKKYSDRGGMIYLLPMNDKYAPIPINLENECFRVVGVKVVSIIKG